ncbi:MAG TPA: flagellar export chaperone FliS [Vicinamibacterales bacterium]|jgi:flagellar protein FliS
MQTAMARAAQAYYQTQVQSQSPLELVVMLYDGALRFMRLAADGTRRRDLVVKRDGMSRAMAILAELQNTLNVENGGEIARSLDGLYAYITSRLIEANIKQDPAPIEESIRLLTPLRDAWAQIAANPGQPVTK